MRLKVCTFFSESHKAFYKHFMNTFPYEENVDLIIRYLPQECSGSYNQDNWNLTMKKKVGFIVEYLNTLSEDEYLVHSDVDVVFYKPFKDSLTSLLQKEDVDILFQNDGCALCMGFFTCKKTDELVSLMKYIYDNLTSFENDQVALNSLIGRTKIKFGVLPDTYYSFGSCNGHKRWTPETPEDFFVPKDIIIHHANWTTGVENKLKLIEAVRKKVDGI